MNIAVRFLSILLISTLLASCNAFQPAEPTPQLPDQQATAGPEQPGQAVISFASWEGDRDSFIALAERFHAEHPDIKVVIVSLEELQYVGNRPSDQVYNPSQDLRRILSGADVAPAFVVQPEMIGSPLILDLKPLMDADASFQRSDYYTGTLDYWSANGGVWGLPRSFSQRTLNYNADLFAAAGIPEPQPGWTWDQLMLASEQVSQSNSYGIMDTSGGTFSAMAMLENAGIDPVKPAANSRLTDDIYMKTFEKLRDLTKRNVIYNPYGSPAQNTPNAAKFSMDPMQIVREGKVALWDSTTFYGSTDSTTFPFKVGTISYPANIGRALQYMGTTAEGYVISSGTAYPQAAWAWIEFLSRQATTNTSADPNMIPARASLAQANNFWESKSEQQTAVIRWSLEHSILPPLRSEDYAQISGISQASNQILSDPKSDIRQVLQTAQQELERMRAEAPTAVPIDSSPLIVATPEPQEPAAGATVVKFTPIGFGAPELRPLIRAFQREHPDIFVKIASTNNITREIKLEDMTQLSDCFMWNRSPSAQEASSQLLDLRPLIDADSTFARDDIAPALWSTYEHAGGLYGLPYTYNVRVLNYNRTLFEQAGLPAPTADWTMQQFLQAAQALSSGEGTQRRYGFANSNSDVIGDLTLFSQRFGATLTRNDGAVVLPNFSDPNTLKAIEWYIDLDKTHHVMPPLNIMYRADGQGDVKGEDIYTLFQKNRVAMWFDYSKSSFDIYDESGKVIESVDVGLAPIPLGKEGLRPGDIQVNGFHISKTAQNPQACWELIKFLSNDLSFSYGSLPARKSLAQSEAFLAQAAPDRIEILKLYESILQRPVISGTSDVPNIYNIDQYWLSKAIMEAARNKTPLQRGLEQAQQMTSSFQTCVAQGGKAPACALQADPDYKGFNTDNMPAKGQKLPHSVQAPHAASLAFPIVPAQHTVPHTVRRHILYEI